MKKQYIIPNTDSWNVASLSYLLTESQDVQGHPNTSDSEPIPMSMPGRRML